MTPTNMQGVRFRLLRGDGNNPETFAFICTIVTLDLDRKVEYDDSMVADCDTPNAIPVRQSTVKAITWDMTFSGKADASKYRTLEADFETATLRNYQMLRDLTAAQGGGSQEGAAYIDSLKLNKSENGVVGFSGGLKGQGTLPWTPAAQ